MTDDTTRGHGQIPTPYPLKDHWEYNLYEYHKGLPDQSHYEFMAHTPGITTAAYWADWCQAIFYAGTTLYLWNEVPELMAAFLSACSLEEDMDVFVIGKYAAESGLAPAVQSVLRGHGRLTVEEIGDRVIDALTTGSPTGGTDLQWDFDYLDAVPDGGLDRVVLFGAASHVADWSRFAVQIARALRQGGRLVIVEAPLGGKEFREALHEDCRGLAWLKTSSPAPAQESSRQSSSPTSVGPGTTRARGSTCSMGRKAARARLLSIRSQPSRRRPLRCVNS